MRRLIIPGKPIAKKRPRFARRGKFVTTYNDQETEEGRFLLSVREQIKDTPIHGAVVLSAMFYMPIPKSTTKKNRALIERGEFPHVKKPDVDNLLKFAMDCLNGEAWTDDSQVVEIKHVAKQYDDRPRTEIILSKWQRQSGNVRTDMMDQRPSHHPV